MELTAEQKNAVATWFAAGASLDEIQKRLASEFNAHLTYLDLRLLVADLPQPQDDDLESATPPPADETPSAGPVTDLPPNELAPQEAAPAAGELSITVDPITPAGVMACGGVTFSDGTSGKWYLDQMGRLGLDGVPAGYRPAPQDAAVFQSRLVEALRAKGLA